MKVSVLTRKDVRDLSVIAGGLEVLDWVLYDTLSIATGAVTQLRFFQQATGQAGITLEKTNMELPGQLPAGYKFVIQKLVATPRIGLALTGALVKDMVAVTHRGYAQLMIGTRPYLQCPLINLIGGAFQGFFGTAVGGTLLEQGYVAPRTIVNGELEYSPAIPANFTFSVQVGYDTAPTVSATTDLCIQAVGKLIRPRQG